MVSIEYPKPVMTMSEMMELGFSRYFLQCAARCKFKDEITIRNGKRGNIYFITASFENLRQKGFFNQSVSVK